MPPNGGNGVSTLDKKAIFLLKCKASSRSSMTGWIYVLGGVGRASWQCVSRQSLGTSKRLPVELRQM